MKLDRTIFKLDVLLDYINEATLMSMHEKLVSAKKGLEKSLNFVDRNPSAFASVFMHTQIESHRLQLKITEENIKTLETALLIKESDAFEHKIELEDLHVQIFCLN
jgi:hypothetical protein